MYEMSDEYVTCPTHVPHEFATSRPSAGFSVRNSVCPDGHAERSGVPLRDGMSQALDGEGRSTHMSLHHHMCEALTKELSGVLRSTLNMSYPSSACGVGTHEDASGSAWRRSSPWQVNGLERGCFEQFAMSRRGTRTRWDNNRLRSRSRDARQREGLLTTQTRYQTHACTAAIEAAQVKAASGPRWRWRHSPEFRVVTKTAETVGRACRIDLRGERVVQAARTRYAHGFVLYFAPLRRARLLNRRREESTRNQEWGLDERDGVGRHRTSPNHSLISLLSTTFHANG